MPHVSDALFSQLRANREVPHGRKWAEQKGAIGAGIAESDFGTADFLKAHLIRAINEDLLTYLPDELAEIASEACRELYRSRFHWSFPTEWVRATPDVLSALHVALEVFPQHTPVIIPTPCYSPFPGVCESMDREVIEVPMPQGFDLELLAASLRTPGSIVLLCNPHNPTGEVLDRDTLRELAEVAEQHDAFLFIDEIHAPLVYRESAHIPFASLSDAAAQRSITAISPSKGWNIPGLKAAHAIIPNDRLRAHWDRLNRHPVRSGSPLGAVGVASAYSEEGLQWLDQLIPRFDANRALLVDTIGTLLPRAHFRPPQATYLAWIDFSDYQLDTSPAEFLLREAGVATVPGSSCGKEFANHIRFNFATSPENINLAIAAAADALNRTAAPSPQSRSTP